MIGKSGPGDLMMDDDMAAIPSVVAEIILSKLDNTQKSFILRMEHHRNDQPITDRDWNDITPCVDNEDGYPDVYWFGGMRSVGKDVGWDRTFRFNEVGLQVRSALDAPND